MRLVLTADHFKDLIACLKNQVEWDGTLANFICITRDEWESNQCVCKAFTSYSMIRTIVPCEWVETPNSSDTIYLMPDNFPKIPKGALVSITTRDDITSITYGDIEIVQPIDAQFEDYRFEAANHALAVCLEKKVDAEVTLSVQALKRLTEAYKNEEFVTLSYRGGAMYHHSPSTDIQGLTMPVRV